MILFCDGIFVFVWILYEFYFLIMVMVCYSIIRLGYIYIVLYYLVNIESIIYVLYDMNKYNSR